MGPDLIGRQSPFQRLIVSSTLTAFDLNEQKRPALPTLSGE